MANMKPGSLLGRFAQKMIKLDFELIGSGKNAAVFKKPDEASYVIKAFEMDVGYLYFLKLIAAHPDNKYFPKILKYDKLEHKEFKGLHFVKMEALLPIDGSDFYTVYNPYERYKKIKPDLDKQIVERLTDQYEEKKENNEGFYATLDLLWDTPIGSCQLDINMENVMRRPRSNWVITDPFVSFEDDN